MSSNFSIARTARANRASLVKWCCSASFGVVIALIPEWDLTAGAFQQDEDGTLHIPAISLPESSFLSEDSRAALRRGRDQYRKEAAGGASCPSIEHAEPSQAAAIRRCEAEKFSKSSLYMRLRERYPVVVTPLEIGGIHTETFVPMEGIAPKNRRRVLINVHGGGFMDGWRLGSHLESVPIAAIGHIKVISIDYREAPEYSFPAASEDVATVYRELLKTYQPSSIGIFGCSAGALLTAESVVWIEKEHLPRPGAVGMLCGGAAYYSEGDTGYIGRTLLGDRVIWGTSKDNPYFKSTSSDDPLAFPVRSSAFMAKFPPSLLISGTRDPALSSTVYTHTVLVGQGVETELHVWEGLGHVFFGDVDLRESRDVYALVAKFFDVRLGE